MIPEPEYRPARKKQYSTRPFIIIAVAAIAAGAWYFSNQNPETEPEMAPPLTPEPFPEAVETAPDIPLVEEHEPSQMEDPVIELPPLAESDAFTRGLLGALSSNEDFSLWIQTENLIQKIVSFIDGLSRGNVLKKIIPIQPPEDKFIAIREDGRLWADSRNYERYNGLTALFTGISPETLSEIFHTLRPLFETAYSELGYPGDKIDNSIIAAIDLILATPAINDPVELRAESVNYLYADPELEALPPVQKQLLRTGPENSAKIKAHLTEIRRALLEGNGETE